MRLTFLILLLFIFKNTFSQDTAVTSDSGIIKVHFLYGSIPKKKYRDIEKPWFGGLHGGHVSIEAEGYVIGFEPVNSVHIVTKNYNKHSKFVSERLQDWVKDTSTLKYTTITIPVSSAQLDTLRKIHTVYLNETPYDYAFLGMRCAAATYDILGRVGVVEWQPNFINTYKNFYPKLLRKKLLKIAKKRGYKIYRQPGRKTRKWERN